MAVSITHRMNSNDRPAGARPSLESLLPSIYSELKVLARGYLARERTGPSNQTTALVHDAYLRLAGHQRVEWSGRTHCVAVAAMVMRRLLVDRARQRRVEQAASLREPRLNDHREDEPFDMLALDEAMTALADHDPRKCRVVELRFFGGLSETEIAQVLGVALRTVERDWRYARAWLFRRLSNGDTTGAHGGRP